MTFNTNTIIDILKYVEDLNRMNTTTLNNILRSKGLPLSHNYCNSTWDKRLKLLQEFIDNCEDPFANQHTCFWSDARSCVSEISSNTRSTYFRDRIIAMRERYVN